MSTNATKKEGEGFQVVTSTVAVLPMENIDTDQIIPARFLKITDTARS